ncbi:hypothetical protein LI221_10010 [Faecalimonas umbilicata]|nr:hypothetical protein [Faecalimonas umbilicata]
MQELERMINLYHTAFLVFLILTIVFFVISIALFILFDIRGIFDMKSGRGAKKAIQKMQELNDQTGKLRQDVVANTPVSLDAGNRIASPPTEKRSDAPAASVGSAAVANTGAQQTELLDEGSRETTILADQGLQATALLHHDNETTVLSSVQMQETAQPEAKKLPGAFKIEKEILWIHTEEML